MSKVYQKLLEVQSQLKAPKSQKNTFGNYNYRNAEDILEALKPLLKEVGAVNIMTDEVIVIGQHYPTQYTELTKQNNELTKVTGCQRYYIKSTATFTDIETGESISVSAFAREEDEKKGMDASQITGSTSSYARKYALNGLYGIDDTKDSDTTNKHGKDDKPEPEEAKKPQLATGQQIKKIESLYTEEEIKKMLANLKKSINEITVAEASKMISHKIKND